MSGRGKKLSKPRKQNLKKFFISKEKNKDRTIIDIRIPFKTEEEKEERKKQEHNERLIKYKIIRDIRTLFQQQGEDYYKPKRVSSLWNNKYIEYESNGDKNTNLSLDECLMKIKPYLMEIIIDRQGSDTWKIQLTIAINLFLKRYSRRTSNESTSDNINFTPYNDANEVLNELFE